MSDYRTMVELASRELGTCVLAANDEFFGEKERLIRPEPPVFIEGKFTDRGKWMDGWETRRRRVPGHDWCVVRLGLPGIVRGFVVDTSHFKGNQPESTSLEGLDAGEHYQNEESHFDDNKWFPLTGRSSLRPDAENAIPSDCGRRVTHVRLNIFPDGGVARLRVYGEPVVDYRRLRSGLDLAALENGGTILTASDMNFGHAHHLISPGMPENMGQGWETRRRRGSGHDWCILRLAAPGSISRADVFTTHFKGNYPESCSIEGSLRPSDDDLNNTAGWFELLSPVALGANCLNRFDRINGEPVSHVRFNIFPDGGVARLRLFGSATPSGFEIAAFHYLNALSDDSAARWLDGCCGAPRWAEQLSSLRPFSDLRAIKESSDLVFKKLKQEELLEAFAAHGRIGESDLTPVRIRQAANRPRDGQLKAAQYSSQDLDRLQRANRAYEDRFGFKFIVCATGKSLEEILGILESRLGNNSEVELRLTAEEERKITQLRLEKLFRQ